MNEIGDKLRSQGLAGDMQEMHDVIEGSVNNTDIQQFKLRARLPSKGRTDTPMAATDKMWVVLKTYAEGGENELHAHPHEDHTFVVLQGKAEISGKDGSLGTIDKLSGFLIPRGAFYKFKSVGDEPLVMLRAGTSTDEAGDRLRRIHVDGNDFDPYSADNHFHGVEFSDEYFG